MTTRNTERSNRFHDALLSYDTDDCLVDCFTDFLTDARHWCDRNGVDYAEIDRRAYHHYIAELGEERGGQS